MISLFPADAKRPEKIEPGNHILCEEDVFGHKKTDPIFLGKRYVFFEVLDMALPGILNVKVVKSKGVNAPGIGSVISRPISNLMRGYICDDCTLEKLKSGGHLVGIQNGEKVILDQANKGGMSEGSTHADGGIKGSVGSEKRPIEFENKEAVLATGVATDTRKYNFNGKQMTAKDIASELNVANGGVSFKEGGEVGTQSHPVSFSGNEIILTAPVTSDKREYEFEGNKLTALQIASKLNENNGGVAFPA